jgi:hypothetical protein
LHALHPQNEAGHVQLIVDFPLQCLVAHFLRLQVDVHFSP